jgi:Predicted Fe-S-cluster redox enzyme
MQPRPRTSITFEYTMLKGINDHPEHARQLVKLMRQLPSKVNLIPFNTFTGTQYERSEEQVIRAFQKQLLDAGVLTMVRRTRGDDIEPLRPVEGPSARPYPPPGRIPQQDRAGIPACGMTCSAFWR